jgi:YfiH family protein
MNLGNPNGCAVQDDDDRIAENYRLLQTAIGCGDRERFWVHQVHGGEVVHATGDIAAGLKADAIYTREPRRVLAVRVADCVPVLLASEDGRAVAAVHAGWRGVIAGAVAHTVAAMNVPPARLLAAVGPSIGFDAFEVGPEVLAAFETAFPADPPTARYADGSGKGTVDLRAALRQQLLGLGLIDANLDTTDRCTVRDADEFFSHRRDHGTTGRMAALIGTIR